VALFLDRAARVRPVRARSPAELSTVADIVRRLDGIPLAIELAAGRLSTFSLTDLRDRLGRSLDLLGGGRPSGDARHRTLRATVEWSYRLLAGDERRLFRCLSVFVDGVALDTAERLAADLGLDSDPGSVLARLVDTSMIEARFEGGTRYHMLETLRAFGLDRLAAAGEDEAAAGRLIRWAVELTGRLSAEMSTEREPDADAVLRRELPNLRAAWRLARARGALDDTAAMVVGLFDSIGYRDLVEFRDWAEELAEDPRIAGHPRASAVLGIAAEAVYHRGHYRRAERLARAGLEKAADDEGFRYCLMVLSVTALARGSHAEAVEHALAADARTRGPREHLGIAALATAYAGDLGGARRLNERGSAGAVSPTMLAWSAYVAGEIDSLAGDGGTAERHYVRAIDLAGASGATFIVGVATVGLLTVRAADGRVHQVLDGYRDVIGYFSRSGNWTHLWATLRNLADLLRRLGDDEPAALIDAAADQAPDAPAIDRSGDTGRSGDAGRGAGPVAPAVADAPVPNRATILDVAREAIERNLNRS
jgi:tetratricopeptide (TPR) repeat protein